MARLCIIEGDGIGKEVIPAAVQVLEKALPGLEVTQAEAGWETFTKRGISVPAETLAAVRIAGRPCLGQSPRPAVKFKATAARS